MKEESEKAGLKLNIHFFFEFFFLILFLNFT